MNLRFCVLDPLNNQYWSRSANIRILCGIFEKGALFDAQTWRPAVSIRSCMEMNVYAVTEGCLQRLFITTLSVAAAPQVPFITGLLNGKRLIFQRRHHLQRTLLIRDYPKHSESKWEMVKKHLCDKRLHLELIQPSRSLLWANYINFNVFFNEIV